MKSSFATKSCAAWATLAGMLAQPSSAGAEAGRPPAPAIEQITVTAQRRPELLQEVPVSVTSFDSERLFAHTVFSVMDLGPITPNLYLQGTGGDGGGIISIRSQTAPEVQLGIDPAVGVYLDGVYLPRQRGNLGKLFDLERVEILRGPQGTLFGHNTTGGAIQIISRRPVHEWQADIVNTVGSYDRFNVQGALNIPLLDEIDEKLAARVAFDATRRDGYTLNLTNGQDLDDDQSQSWRASLLWQPTQRIESLFVHDGMIFEPNGPARRITGAVPTTEPGFTPQQCAFAVIGGVDVGGIADCMTGGQLGTAVSEQAESGPYEVTSNIDSFLRIRQFGIQNTTAVDLEPFTLRNIASYRQLYQNNNLDPDGTDFQLLRGEFELDQWQVSEELQFFGSSFEATLDWMTGFYFFREEGSDTNTMRVFELAQLPIPLNPTQFDADVANTHVSLYGQATWALPFLSRVSLTGGIRYNYDRREFSSRNSNGLGCILSYPDSSSPSPCVGQDSVDYHEPTWTVSLDWDATDDWLLYVAHRRGYRAGGFNLRKLDLTASGGFEPFDPETVTDIEVGAKGDWQILSRPVRTNLAAFYADYGDIQRTHLRIAQLQPIGFAFVTEIENAAEAGVYGGEFEVTALPFDDLHVVAGIGISIARYETFLTPGPDDPSQLVDRSDEHFTNAPDYGANVSVRYTLPTDELNGVTIGSWGLQIEYQWRSRVWLSFNQGDGSLEQEPYGIFNLRLDAQRIGGTNFSLAFFCSNVLDRRYRTGGVNAFDSLGFSHATYGVPRSFGGQIGYRFP